MVTTTKFGSGGIEVSGSAPVAFTHGAGQVDSDIVVEWDFDNDGDFSEAVENVTSYMVSLETQAGRDFPSQLTGRAGPGRLRMTLRNDDDRFSYFNVDSPLATLPFSLKTGRKIRVRTAEAANPDPTLLDRDRFRRSDSSTSPGTTELGRTWTNKSPTGVFGITDERLTAQTVGTDHWATIDVGVTDYVVQARLAETGKETAGISTSTLSVVYRFQDTSNWSHLRLNIVGYSATVALRDIVADVATEIDSANIELTEDVTLTVAVSGSTVKGFVDGLEVVSGTAIQTDETEVGVYAFWETGQPAPAFDDFYVWDAQPSQEDGVIWTGEIEKVAPRTTVGPEKVVEVTAVGRLARLTSQEVPTPRFLNSQTVGIVVGHVLGQAGLLHPIGPVPPGKTQIIDQGTVVTGPITGREPTGKALDIVRRFEEHELGFFSETNEGYPRFDARNARASAVPLVTFSDAPGAQFSYADIEPHDREREIVNQVTAGVAQGLAELDATFSGQGGSGAGVQTQLTFTIPAGTGDGDLIVLIWTWAGGSGSGESFLTPIWWVNHRDIPGGSDQVRTRIYTHVSDGTEVGNSFTFYADTGSNGGSYILYALRFPGGSWYGTYEGIHVVEPVKGSNPPAMIPPWGAVPTCYIAFRSGLSSVAGASVSGAIHPLGYGVVSDFSAFQNGATNSRDVGLQVSTRYSNDPIEDPGAFGGTFSGFTTVESGLIAIRGYNGSPPEEDLRLVQSDNYDSQDDHNRIATYVNASNLYDTEANATTYADAVLGQYSEDRPIFSISFFPTLSPAYRAQAVRRRVSDKVTLVAHNETGMLSAPADFFIENINHQWSNAGKRWVTTWELSPA